jgi:hypothetical protein
MYKDKGGKIYLGPLWDFDGAFCYAGGGENSYFGNSNYHISTHPFFYSAKSRRRGKAEIL